MIGVSQIAAWRKKWEVVHEALTQGDPGSADPRDFGLPQWWPLDDEKPSDDRLLFLRREFYGSRGSDPERLVPQFAEMV